ncbi:unnamed protein product [Rotaria sp. Silwood2]|nr:unnamed protein product [Rotaria sp. Silwood2]
MKLISSVGIPLTIGIFTLVTTLQNRHIARQEREQDINQAQDEQREAVFITYINDISRFRDQNLQNLTKNADKLVYIHSKTLAALRTLDVERKKNILLFLRDSSLLSEDENSILSEADFSRIHLENDECLFFKVIFSGANFYRTSFRNCLFDNVIFRRTDFRFSDLAGSIFMDVQFIECSINEAIFHDTILSEVTFNGTTLARADFSRAKLDSIHLFNVNLTKAIFDNQTQVISLEIKNSILPNGSFSQIDDLFIAPKPCESLENWQIKPVDTVQVENCTLVAKIPDVNLEQALNFPFVERSLLVDAHQAELEITVEQSFNTQTIRIDIIFVGRKSGVYKVFETNCTTNLDHICQHHLHVPSHTRWVYLSIYLPRVGDAIVNVSYRLRQIDVSSKVSN